MSAAAAAHPSECKSTRRLANVAVQLPRRGCGGCAAAAAAAGDATAAGSLRIGAHRGAMSYAPENTLRAFEIAIDQGAPVSPQLRSAERAQALSRLEGGPYYYSAFYIDAYIARACRCTGVYRIECDIRMTADGVLVLMHDATVDRTTDGTGELRGMTYSEVRHSA